MATSSKAAPNPKQAAHAPKKQAKPKILYSTKVLNDFMAQCQTIPDDDKFPVADEFTGTRPRAILNARLIPVGENNYALSILDGAKNADERVPIASITKNVFISLIFEKLHSGDLRPDQRIDIPMAAYCLPDNKYAVEPLQGITNIRVDEAITLGVRQSNNTTIKALAIAAFGSEEKAVEAMNKLVEEWGLKNTRFANTTGMPQGDRSGEYTTANDLAVMMQMTMAYASDYKTYESRDMTVNGRKFEHKESAIRKWLLGIGGWFKSATSHACNSFVALVPLKEEFHLSVSMCAGDGQRYAALTEAAKENGLSMSFATGAKAKTPTAKSKSTSRGQVGRPILVSHLTPSSD